MTMIIDDKNERVRALIFHERRSIVHISKTDGRFYNGIIMEVGSNWFILRDRLTGNEIMILFNELKKPIEIFREVE